MKDSKSTRFTLTQKNELAYSAYAMNLQEKRLLILAMSKLTKANLDFPCWRIPIALIAEYLDIKGKNLHGRLENICCALLSRVAKIKKPSGGWKAFQFLSHCEYIPAKENNGMAVLEIMLHQDMAPFLLEIKGNYNSIEFDLLSKFSSIYAVRLYELLHHKRKESGKINNIHTIELMALREMLFLEKKYTNYADFKKKVLTVSQFQFKQRTPLCFDFTENRARKSGAPVESVEFTIYDNRGYCPDGVPNITTKMHLNMEINSKEERKQKVFELFKDNVNKAVFFKMINDLEKKGERLEKITENLELAAFQIAKNPKQIKNPVAYCLSSIEQNWARV